jgi:hypothetical protein
MMHNAGRTRRFQLKYQSIGPGEGRLGGANALNVLAPSWTQKRPMAARLLSHGVFK